MRGAEPADATPQPPSQDGRMILSTLDEVRGLIQTGDVLAYGQDHGPGEWIEWFTDSDQSHVATAVVIGDLLLVVEATAKGVQVRPLTVNFEHAADVWFLPLSEDDRELIPQGKLLTFFADVCERRVPYDFRALFPWVWRRGRPPEDFSHLYCSELVALGFRHTNLYAGTVELTPVEVCQLALYAPRYYCLKWNSAGPKTIAGYNTVDPADDEFARRGARL